MRINKYIALATGVSRRKADQMITEGRVLINGQIPKLGHEVGQSDIVTLSGKTLALPLETTTIMLNKPQGYVTSRRGQGSKTIYNLLPKKYHSLKPIGRLDKDSAGLLLLTNDGELANKLSHPRYVKEKIYEVKLNRPLKSSDKDKIEEGVLLADGISTLGLRELPSAKRLPTNITYEVRMSEGRNRQIRRTFLALGYKVTKLRRTRFGPYSLGTICEGDWQNVVKNVKISKE